jgi:hypothetical protein
VAWGALTAIHAGDAHAQGGNYAGNTTPGAANLYAPPTGGPAQFSTQGAHDNLPSNLEQPGLGGNTVKSLAGAPMAAGAPVGPAAPAAVAGAPAGGGAVAGGENVAVAGVAAGLSTISPVTVLGNGMQQPFNGFPFGGFGGPNGGPNGFQNGFPNGNASGQTNCWHVINMLTRHCWGNRLFPCQQGQPGFGGGMPNQMFPGFFGQQPGDLELVGVNIVSESAANNGPLYQVSIKNASTVEVQNFRVTLVAVLGTINAFSPNVTVTVPTIAAGAVANVTVQMPANVMAMGVPTQPLVAFDTLVVAIDSYDELIESNELNNVATLKRVGIPVVVVTTTETAIAGPGAAVAAPSIGGAPGAVGGAPGAIGAPSAPSGPAAPNGPALQEGAPAPAPAENALPKPTDKINLDNIDLGETETAATQAPQ